MSGYLKPCILGALVGAVTAFSATYWLTQPAKALEIALDCTADSPGFRETVDGQTRLLAMTHDSAAAVKAVLIELSRLADEGCKRKSGTALAALGKRGWLALMISEFLTYHYQHCRFNRGVSNGLCLDTFVKWRRATWVREDLTEKILKDLDIKPK
jgi:hypothetical protein